MDQNIKKLNNHNANRNTGTSSQILLLLSLKPDESLNIKLTKKTELHVSVMNHLGHHDIQRPIGP